MAVLVLAAGMIATSATSVSASERARRSTAPHVATKLTGRWEVGNRSVPQGSSLRYRLVVANSDSMAATASFAFDVYPARRPEAAVPFDRWTGSIRGGGEFAIKGEVTPAQWFAETGRFVIRVRTTHDIRPLRFRVSSPPVRVPQFSDVSATSGLETLHVAPIRCDGYSAGAAWGDVEGDGDLDLYLPQRGVPSRLFVNDAGTFVDEAELRGADNLSAAGIGAVFADYDNDGDQDLYVVNDGPNRLLRNDGTGAFEDVTAAAGVGDDGAGSGASWGDYDADGNLDLYVVNWARCQTGGGYDYHRDVLYHNEGDGTFSDKTARLEVTGSTKGAGFQAAWFDYDGDGDQDLYLANDYGGPAPEPNYLWRNDGPGTNGWRFTDVSIPSHAGLSMNAMGLGIGDPDRDQDLDIAISNIEATAFLDNRGDGTFKNLARRVRVARPNQRVREKSITWGLAFYDLNLDGWEDLYVAGGSLAQENYPEPQPNATFINDGKGRFYDLSAPSRADDDAVSRGVAFADYDRDGDIDLYVVNQGGNPRLLRNGNRGGHWLEVALTGRSSNRDACGALLRAKLDRRTTIVRQRFCGSISLGSGHDPAVHFGLGRKDRVRRLTVVWPSGIRQIRKNVQANRLIRLTEPAK
jgi:hypothetical protein